MSAFTNATQQVKKVCRRCGREFWIDAYLAPKLTSDYCRKDDCAPRQEFVVIHRERTPQQQAAFDWLAREWYAIAMSDSAPSASAETGADMQAAA